MSIRWNYIVLNVILLLYLNYSSTAAVQSFAPFVTLALVFKYASPKPPSSSAQIQCGRRVLSLHCGSSQWFFFPEFNWWCIFFFISPFLLLSLRVNLDMGKIVYSWVIRRDSKIPGTVVRSSTIPEQLGRISYLLTDKTGVYVENTVLSRGVLLFGLCDIFC